MYVMQFYIAHKKWVMGLLGATLALAVLFAVALGVSPQQLYGSKDMPEFHNQDPGRWINTKPLSLQDFKGQVVLIEIWTSI